MPKTTMKKYLEDLQAKGMNELPAEIKIADVMNLYARIDELTATLKISQKYLSHPDVVKVTEQMALSGKAVNERIEKTLQGKF